jgi:hypothetical protein
MTAQLEAAAGRRLADALRQMGSDPCIFSLDLIVDQIATELAADADTQNQLRALLRGQLGLRVQT